MIIKQLTLLLPHVSRGVTIVKPFQGFIKLSYFISFPKE